MSLFLNRFFRAAKLDVSLYQEIVEDGGAMNQAFIVVLIYSMASAYGTFGRTGATGINIGMVTTLLGWYVWAFSTYIVGARFLPETQTKPDRKALLRTLGFASAPGVLRVLGFLQGLGLVSTSRALGVCIIGLIISAVFQGLMFILMFSAFGVTAG
jgi:hypothetical protein